MCIYVLLLPYAVAQQQYGSVLGIEMGKTTVAEAIKILNDNNIRVEDVRGNITFSGNFYWQGLPMAYGVLMSHNDTICLGMYMNGYNDVAVGQRIVEQTRELFATYPQLPNALLNFFHHIDNEPTYATWTQDAPHGLYIAAKQNMLMVCTFSRSMLLALMIQAGVVLEGQIPELAPEQTMGQTPTQTIADTIVRIDSTDIERYSRWVQLNQLAYTTIDSIPLDSLRIDAFDAHIISHVYENNYGLITFDTTLTMVRDSAFYNATNIATIVLPSSVKKIGTMALVQCADLDTIYLQSPIPPSVNSTTFAHYNTTLVVPCQSVDKYLEHDIWQKFAIWCDMSYRRDSPPPPPPPPPHRITSTDLTPALNTMPSKGGSVMNLPIDEIVKRYKNHHFHLVKYNQFRILDYCDFYIQDKVSSLAHDYSDMFCWQGLPVNFARIVGFVDEWRPDFISPNPFMAVYVRILSQADKGLWILEHARYKRLFNQLKYHYTFSASIQDAYAEKLIEILRKQYKPQCDLWCKVNDEISYYVFINDDMFFAMEYNRDILPKFFQLDVEEGKCYTYLVRDFIDVLSLPDPYVYHEQ